MDFREKHYTPQELAELWKVSPDTIRRRFEDEGEGVLKFGSGGGRGKSRKITLRISESAAQRVYQQYAK